MSLTNNKIDLVYLWVDGSDTEWLSKKYKFLGKEIDLNNEATSIARNANNDELRYSLRSIEKYASWINKIYIVTDGQTPAWLNLENDKVQITDIRTILPTEALPCYNSVIIEHFLYKIPGLSEQFLYANDDMFINKKIGPEFFFNKKGYPIVRLQRAYGGKWLNALKVKLKIHRNIYRTTIDNSAKLIEKKYGKYFSGTPHHNIDAYLKSDYSCLVEKEFNTEILNTIEHHLRNVNDIQRIIYLYFALAQNKGELKYVNRWESVRIRVQKQDFMYYITKYRPALFCLNDTHRATNDDRRRIKPFLENLFPEKSAFEK